MQAYCHFYYTFHRSSLALSYHHKRTHTPYTCRPTCAHTHTLAVTTYAHKYLGAVFCLCIFIHNLFRFCTMLCRLLKPI